MLITDRQVAIDLFSQEDGFHFQHEGQDCVLPSMDKVHAFFQKQLFDTVKLCHGGKKSYVHFGMDDVEIYPTKRALQRTLCQEGGGAWIEKRAGKKLFFIEEKGWLTTSYKEVSKKECLEKLESTSTLTKALGVALGILALAPGVCEFARRLPFGAKEAGISLLTLQQKSLLLGAVGFSCLPSAADAQALGTEFRVNTYTTIDQRYPSIAPLNDGGFVVTWQSWEQDGSYSGIFGQRYNATGARAGTEFQVNTYTTDNQFFSSIAGLIDGGVVVTWASAGQDGSGAGIFGQRYDASGARAGTEFQVNTYTTSNQEYPSVASLNDGGFVVSWESFGQDGSGYGIYGQRYNATGARAGLEFRVNTYTTIDQRYPSIAPLNDGGIVVSWESFGQDGSGYGIYGQRYNATGARAGTEFRVNTYTTIDQRYPSVAPLNDGGFVVTWQSNNQDGSNYGIYGQRYNATGARAGTEFQVNTYTTSAQQIPSVAPLNDGGFVVTWESLGQDGDSWGIFGQRYNAIGARAGTEFQVNTYTTRDQDSPSVAPLNDGGFVVSWQSDGQDGESWGIFGQRYDSNGNPVGLTVQTQSSGLPSQMSISAFQSNLTPSPSQIISTSSPNLPTSGVSLTSGSIIYSVIDIVYEESYPIYVNGQTVGTYTISGGSGQLDSSNPNVITMHFNPSFAPEEEDEFIPLFSIPAGQATDWQSIQLGDTEFECLEAHAEINPSSSVGDDFGLIFTGADSCTASGSQIVAGLLPIMMN